ncbi:EAL domain-containing protein [Hahella sp. KA22]|uniref:bifunctional diguanylate cyclase/phosphodiesterase n=1 Tax=Hahella sp. KA22 TaxID=1628392 RepID=UPI000FDCEF4D|nr:EAL domain-containing protein [Hahella sp. KA22]AZZ89940.1 EAL domain-containing protein [Hahella sp. KA22]QAY53309.1 EAL domain-containing protein [Hahella sp. KA22]
MTLSLWSRIDIETSERRQHALDYQAEFLSKRITRQFLEQVRALERLAAYWDNNDGFSKETWRKNAEALHKDFPNFKAIEWTDKNYVIQWIEPMAGNEQALGFNVAFNESRRRALEAARAQGDINATPVITLQQGGQGVVVYAPISKGEDFQGFIVGVFLVEQLLGSLISPQEEDHFHIRVYEEDKLIFSNSSADVSPDTSAAADWKPLQFSWRLSVQPKSDWLHNYSSPLPAFVMSAGTVSSALLAWVCYLAMSLGRQRRSLLSANESLQSEIANRQEVEQTLSHVITHDALTGLPNRSFFQEDLAQAILRAQRANRYLAVMLVDLDQFKKINDTLTHSAGDQLVVALTKRFNTLLESEISIARAGGDEFMILLENPESVDEVIAIANRIMACMKQPFTLNDEEVFITCSIGIAVYPEGGVSAEDLIRNADAALYRAKAAGRNGYHFYTTGMHAEALKRLELDRWLREAIERNELSLAFQPKVNLKTREYTGAEALLRWYRPEQGFISPAEFIPLAEETGLIKELGMWVVRRACQQLSEWRGTPLGNIRLAINLSAIQLEDKELVHKIDDLLREFDVPPRQLEFELTEEVFIQNIESNMAHLNELIKMGFRLSIDDFGVGYSSLAYLKHFPISCIKIDRSFVSQLETNADDRVIINAVIAMAHNLNLSVVAEGVETEAQATYLQKQGCDEAQGYLFAKPLPPDQLYKLATSLRNGTSLQQG